MNKTVSADKSYEPVIGLEVHVELSTKSKMFCRCSADYFGKEPNAYTCPVCLGLPGALPYINKQAIEDCIKIGLALNCQISEKSIFERKNYFYPDLPKGYQISQYRWPLCTNGKLKIDNGQWIRINRVHQEEDTGKLLHQGNKTLIDFNRSGVPLVEIVTEPDFHDVESVRDYAKKLQQIFRYLEVSSADMERGDMRLEANVSVRRIDTSLRARQGGRGPLRRLPSRRGRSEADSEASNLQRNGKLATLRLRSGQALIARDDDILPNYRVELKNINSFRFMVAAIEYEIKRQITALEKGEKLFQQTRGWDEDKKCTYLQRSKEEAHDYRYFPEPDLPELRVTSEELRIKKELPELPWDKEKRFIEKLLLTRAQAKILSETKKLADFFESAVEHGNKHNILALDIANYIINKKPDIDALLPAQIIKKLQEKKAGVIEDTQELEKLARQVITKIPKAAEDYKKGKIAALQVLIGAVMRLSDGKADTAKLKPILEELLNKN